MAIKLYYTQTSCGAANFIAANIGGLDFEGYEVDIGTHKVIKTGEDYYTINPKGNVPYIIAEDDTRLAENTATLAFIAANAPNDVGPKPGSNEFFTLINALGFISSELHCSGLGPLFNPKLTDDEKTQKRAFAKSKVEKFVNNFLGGGKKEYILGNKFSAADSYAYIVLSWSGYLQVELTPEAQTYFDRIKALSQVQESHKKMAEA
eukprot:m.33564 g.33564  ORF g.33564 m.33564 type:complete len:206 (+) comp8568_c0_seq2:228-845(+)